MVMLMKKVCIITWHQYYNYGSQLQAYALVKILRNQGFDAHILNYNKNETKKVLSLKLRCALGMVVAKSNIQKIQRFRYPWLRYQQKYLFLTRPVSIDDLKQEASKYDVIVCGSDQIWAPNVFNSIYMADFISGKDIRKISYAASIGLKYIPDSLVLTYQQLLSDFYAISIREDEGAFLLKSRIGVEAQVVLDPTLLLDKDNYIKIEAKPLRIYSQFGFCYFLNKNHWYKDLVQQYAKEHNITLIGFSANADDSSWIISVDQCGPREFLWYIHHAKIVFTDSYHGTIFSLIYHTQFYTFQRFAEDDPINQNSRIIQLNRYFNICSRMCGPETIILKDEVYDYKGFDSLIDQLRKESIKYLVEAIDNA